MTNTLFLQPEDVATPVANDVPAGALRANVHHVPAVSAIVASRNGTAEMMLFVEEGMIELAINGIDGYLSQGEFARIAPGVHYAFRNKNKTPARVLSVPVVRTERTLRVVHNDAA
jgi:mannose-6-phosphate isomerase-like protein (cupin superfamily)